MVRMCLCQHALDRVGHEVRLVVAGDDDRNQRRPGRSTVPPASAHPDQSQLRAGTVGHHRPELQGELGSGAGDCQGGSKTGASRPLQLGEGGGQVRTWHVNRNAPHDRVAVEELHCLDGCLIPNGPAHHVKRMRLSTAFDRRRVEITATNDSRHGLGQFDSQDLGYGSHSTLSSAATSYSSR
jgi:hypothetical protein